MRTIVFSIALIALMGGPAPLARGEERLSLEVLIDEAVSQNPEIAAAREKATASRERVPVAGWLDDPQFQLELMDLPGDRFTLSPSATEMTRYTFSQQFPFPGKLGLRREAARFDASSLQEDTRAVELEIVAKVKAAYYEYAYLTESVRITREIREIVGQFAKTAAGRYATGLVAQHDVIKAQVEHSMLANEIVTLEQDRAISRARINTLLSRPVRQALGDPGPLKHEEIPIDRDAMITEAVGRNPMLAGAAEMVKARQMEISLARRNYFPDFMLSGAPVQRGTDVGSYNVMVGINIPIWTGKYGHQVREANANRRAADAMLEDRKNSVLFGVEQSLVAIEASGHHIELFETSVVPQAELAFKSGQVNYRTGKVDFLSLLESERDLRKARLDYARALADYQLQVAELERWIGRRLN